ncbi:serine hydrolase domain-containing protein [Bradyrhizobium erythrophlei]|uniref:serine hydrolase domain-containing protein n=1 Tax=Bradyrhizobium erythrophlei TaxID=1437360 RepID=UPI0035EF1197
MTAHILREGAPEDVGMDHTRIQRLRQLIGGWVQRGDTPSVVVLVARRGVIVLHEAFGVRRPEDTTPTLKLDSIFPIASCAKPLTAAAVMCLVDDGLIGLNRPFADYIPELDLPEMEWLAESKVANLLCHTAGIDDLELGDFIDATAKRSPNLPPPGPGQHPKLNTRIRLAAGAPLAHRPGSACIYSNFGYNLLGDIVRRVSGQPFWQFVRSRLFEPLGMHDSYFLLPSTLRERRVYRVPGMPATEPNPMHGGIDSPERDELDLGSGGASSTAKDLAIFLQMLLNQGSYDGQQILSAASVAAMTRHQVDRRIPWIFPWINPATGERVDVKILAGGYGYGLAIFGEGDRFRMNGSILSLEAFGHIGNGGSCLWADPAHEVVGVYLSVSPRLQRGVYTTNSDLLQNAVHAAIID